IRWSVLSFTAFCPLRWWVPSPLKPPVASRSQPCVEGVAGLPASPPLFAISHSLVAPVDAFCHITSVVPSPLKSPVASKDQPRVPGVKGLLTRPPLGDISHSLG